MACQQKQSSDDREETTKPSESGTEPSEEFFGSVDIRQTIDELTRVLQFVVKLRAKHTCEGGPKHDVVGNLWQVAATRLRAQHKVRGHEGQPHENAESA